MHTNFQLVCVLYLGRGAEKGWWGENGPTETCCCYCCTHYSHCMYWFSSNCKPSCYLTITCVVIFFSLLFQTVVNLPVSKALNTAITHSPALNVTVDLEVSPLLHVLTDHSAYFQVLLVFTYLSPSAFSHEYSCWQRDRS